MNQADNDTVWTSRWKFLAIVAIFALPALAAAIWYFAAPMLAPGATANGELIQPARPLQAFTAQTAGGEPFVLDDLEGLWHMVHVVDGACGDACRERIHYTRQIRDALGHERIRVRRLLVATDAASLADLTDHLADHPDMIVLAGGSADRLLAQLPGERGNQTVFLVDPLANLMMRFDAEVDPGGILDDIKKLLRISRIG